MPTPRLTRDLVIVLFLGFSSGLPLALTGGTLQAWLTEAGVSLKTIGLFALVGTPYTTKFLWASVFDRFVPPFLGRRRGWLIILQLLLAGTITLMSSAQPGAAPMTVAALAVALSFLSASQDVVIDAYRAEILPRSDLGLGAGTAVLGYRLAMLTSGALALILADTFPWPTVYLIMAGIMASCALVTLLAGEPMVEGTPPRTLREAVFAPFSDLLKRRGAFELLLFVVLYKLGDVMAAQLSTSFLLSIEFSKTEIGAVTKGFGLAATIIGSLWGGAWIARLGLYRSLVVFGVAQALTILTFAALALIGHNTLALAVAIGLENVTGGMGTAALTAFLMTLCNKRFTASQYALLSSLTAISRTVIGAPTGYLAQLCGWPLFFVLCCGAAIPGLLMLRRFPRWEVERG